MNLQPADPSRPPSSFPLDTNVPLCCSLAQIPVRGTIGGGGGRDIGDVSRHSSGSGSRRRSDVDGGGVSRTSNISSGSRDDRDHGRNGGGGLNTGSEGGNGNGEHSSCLLGHACRQRPCVPFPLGIVAIGFPISR